MSNDELKELKRQTTNKISQYHNMQLAKKILLNSCYGAMSNEYFHFYSDVLAESITLSGQLSIKFIAKKLNTWINQKVGTSGVDYVIAVDTDSNYLTLNPLIEKFLPNADKEKIVTWIDKICKDVIEPFIDKSYDELAEMMNAYDQKMKMKREAIADRGIWTGKKRYIMNVWDLEGVRYPEPVVKVTGLETVRSNTPYICREYLKKCIKLIMTESEEAMHAYIKECKDDFFGRRFDEVGKPSGVEGVEKYSDRYTIFKKGTPWHVRGSLLYNNTLKKHKLDHKYELIGDQDKIRTCWLKLPNPVHENCFSVPDILPHELKLDQYIDYHKQWEVTFLKPLRGILHVINWDIQKRISILDFFEDE